MSLQVLSHGTLELTKPLIQPSHFIGEETEAQGGDVTNLSWSHESGPGWAATPAANSEPGCFSARQHRRACPSPLT